MITDDQSLNGARYGSEHNPGQYQLRIWDDSFGPLWIYRETLGPVGIVRAQTWYDAHECVVDEIMDDGDMDDAHDESGELWEGYHYRGNGIPSNPALKSPVAAEDLNGSSLTLLDNDLAKALGIVLLITDDR